MNLLKKIIILVNLILCMLCINAFATKDLTFYFEYNDEQYTLNVTNVPDKYIYYDVVVETSTKALRIAFSETKSCFYTPSGGPFYFYQYSGYYKREFFRNFSSTTINYDFSNFSSTVGGNSDGNVYLSTYIVYANYDIYNRDTGEIAIKKSDVLLNGFKPSFDDSTINWEDAFDYYITSRKSTEVYKYLGGRYSDIMNLYMKPNSLDGLIDNEELHNNNIYYLFKFNVTFKFKQSDGNINMYPLDVSPIMTIDDYYDLEIPYLVGNIAKNPGGNVIYDGLNELTKGFLDKYIVTDTIDDSIGLINYDVLIQPYVVKQITYPEYSEEIIYTYDIITVSNDNSSDNYVPFGESPIIDYPKPNDKDIYVIIGPDGEIIDGVDNSNRYDFGEDWELIDTFGEELPIRPIINKENNQLEWTDPNGNVTHTVPIGDSIPTEEEIAEETENKSYYDINSVINGLKTTLDELFTNNDSLSKMVSWFRQIFELLPFDLLKIFALIIAFIIIFKFLHLI